MSPAVIGRSVRLRPAEGERKLESSVMERLPGCLRPVTGIHCLRPVSSQGDLEAAPSDRENVRRPRVGAKPAVLHLGSGPVNQGWRLI